MAKKRHWLKHLFSFKRQVRLNNNRILEDSTILFESKKRKSIYMYSKKLLIEVSTYGKEYLVKLYKFSKKGLKLISQKSSLGNKKLKKVITFLLVAIGITISNIEAERIDEYLNSNSTTPTEIHLVMNSNSITSTRWPFIIESKNSMINNDNDCLLVRSEGPSNLGPSNFPISPTVNPGRPTVTPGTGKGLVPYVNPYRVSPKLNTNLAQNPNANNGGGNPGGNGGSGGSSSSNENEIQNTCPNPNSLHAESERPNPSEELIPTKQKNKERKKHLDTEIEMQDEIFIIERAVAEKKGPSHGPDFGLEPDKTPDGRSVRDPVTNKHRAKQNKETYEQFPRSVEGFMKDQDTKLERNKYFRKGRENEQKAIVFINHDNKRCAIFNAETKKFISGWVLGSDQYTEYLETNNIR